MTTISRLQKNRAGPEIRVGLHYFVSDPTLKQRDGVNLAHSEINSLITQLSARSDMAFEFHDFDNLLGDRDYARRHLEHIDVVLCNVGPHAHYYHALREELGLSFRIVRDIKTALWSSYLLQETLCETLIRSGDVLLVTSNYSRVLTRKLFPHLAAAPIGLFEPVLVGQSPAAISPRPASSGAVTLGYVGRLSEDKNFPQIIALLIELNRQKPGTFRLVACGAVHSPSCDPVTIAEYIQRETGRTDLFTYLEPVPHHQVISLIKTFDYFLFFSTSNLEVLGRVMIEAVCAGTPVLAADHAAAAELLTPSSLIPVTYPDSQCVQSHFDAPMGLVDIAFAAPMLLERRVPDLPATISVNNPEVLAQALLNKLAIVDQHGESKALSPSQRKFIDGLHWETRTRYADKREALAVVAELRDWFCALNGGRGVDFTERVAELKRRSRFLHRTEKFIDSLSTTRGDFTNLGGIDIELCNIARYFPRFNLNPVKPEAAVLQSAGDRLA